MKNQIVTVMHDILMTHVGETLSAEFVSSLSKFLDEQASELGDATVLPRNTSALADETSADRTSLELKQVSSDLEIISREFPVIWNDAMLGTLAAEELARIRKSGALAKHSPLDQYRMACQRVMTAFCTRPDGMALH